MSKELYQVMLVDDDPLENEINKKILIKNGFAGNVIAFTNGKEALEYIKDNQDNVSALPDIVFLDIHMPVIDGYSFLFEFNYFIDSIKEKSKIYVLSNIVSSSDINTVLDNDFVVDFIPKPLTSERLNNLINGKKIYA